MTDCRLRRRSPCRSAGGGDSFRRRSSEDRAAVEQLRLLTPVVEAFRLPLVANGIVTTRDGRAFAPFQRQGGAAAAIRKAT